MAAHSEASAADRETQPLLEPSGHNSASFGSVAQPHEHSKEWEDVEAGSAKDNIMFDSRAYLPEQLNGWSALVSIARSIWLSRTLWLTMFKLTLLSITSGLLIAVCLPFPASSFLYADKMMEITKFLTVFVGLLLGFFLSSSLSRWHVCSQGILELCDAIRNLQMQLVSLGVPKEYLQLCIRYGLLSGCLLKVQLLVESKDSKEMEAARERLWQHMLSDNDHKDLGCTQRFTRKEFEAIRVVADPPGLMWTWVTSLVARLAKDGDIPGMATPTYGRIMNLAQEAHKGIRTVRSSISVQAPFVYVHTLAYLVHVNNILYALCLGAVGGSTMADYFHKDIPRPKRAVKIQVINFEVFFVACFICVIGPFLYQAIMEIGLALAQPFASDIAPVPIERLLNLLEDDLADSEDSTAQPPYWEKASFTTKK